MVNSIFTLLALPALALCAPHPQHRHTYIQYYTVITTVGETAVQSTVPATSYVAPTSTVTPTSTAAYSTASYVASASPSSSMTASSGQVVFKNNCDYKVSVKPYPGTGCSCGEGGDVEAGASWNDTLTDCSGGNTSLKVYKDDESTPMQFEYGLSSNMVWYDMSFINCVASGNDFSSCAGGGWAMRANEKCHAYSCTGGSECCTQGYCDPYATGVDPAPNSGCGAGEGYTDPSELGIVIELCGSS